MATEPEAGCSKHADSDEAQHYECSECFKSGKQTEATHYCPSCDAFYCKPCLCDHSVLGRSDIEQWGSSKKRKTEDVCVRHPHELLGHFCKTHDELCCRLCLSTQHRFCSDTAELKSIEDDISTPKDIEQILAMLSGLKDKAERLQEDRKLRCKTVNSSYNDCLVRIGAFRKRINSALDDIELDLSNYKYNYIDMFRRDQKVCEDALATLGVFQQRLHETEHQITVVELKKCKEWAKHTSDNFAEINKTLIKDAFVPIELSDIENTVQIINKLGEVNMTFLSFSAMIDGDEDTCEIGGMCQLPDGSFIIADTKNKKLKKFDSEIKAIGHWEFESCPQDVCVINDTDVAVAMDDQKSQFVSAGTILQNKTIPMDHESSNIASVNDMLFCPYRSYYTLSFDIYEMTGKVTCTLPYSIRESGENSTPVAIWKGADTQRIFVVLHDSCLVSFIYKDSKMTRLETSEIFESPVGVCVDGEGFVYVSDRDTSKVTKLDRELLDKVVASITIPERPGALCYDRRHGRVFVACQDNDTVFVI